MCVEAVYDADTPGAEAWSKRAAALAPDIWESLAVRRKGRVLLGPATGTIPFLW